jgi:hypothetical protein
MDTKILKEHAALLLLSLKMEAERPRAHILAQSSNMPSEVCRDFPPSRQIPERYLNVGHPPSSPKLYTEGFSGGGGR